MVGSHSHLVSGDEPATPFGTEPGPVLRESSGYPVVRKARPPRLWRDPADRPARKLDVRLAVPARAFKRIAQLAFADSHVQRHISVPPRRCLKEVKDVSQMLQQNGL